MREDIFDRIIRIKDGVVLVVTERSGVDSSVPCVYSCVYPSWGT